jgi:hypothetical protein
MKPAVSVCVSCVLIWWASETLAAGWWSMDETSSFSGSDGKLVKVDVIQIDLKKANLKVSSIPFEVGGTLGSTELSIRDFAVRLSKESRFRQNDWILVNGGFSSYHVDVPLGLLVISSKVYSNLTKEKPKQSLSPIKSDYSQYRWSGVFCQGETSLLWDIIPAERYVAKMCRHALQAGPVPVEPESKVAISLNEPNTEKPYIRTVICMLNNSTLSVAITRTETHLLPMARWLSKPRSDGGLGCRVALNLSGDSSSGSAIYSSREKQIRFVGDGVFPIPTALIFEEK